MKTDTSTILICNECGIELYVCAICGDYIRPKIDTQIICMEKGHCHVDCELKEEKKEAGK